MEAMDMATDVNSRTADIVDRQAYNYIFNWLSQNLQSKEKEKVCFCFLEAIYEYSQTNERVFITKEQFSQFCKDNNHNQYKNRSWGTIEKEKTFANKYWLFPACYKLNLDYEVYLSATTEEKKDGSFEHILSVKLRKTKEENTILAKLIDDQCGSAKDNIWLSTFVKNCETAKDTKIRIAQITTMKKKPPTETSIEPLKKEIKQYSEETHNRNKSLFNRENWEVTRVVCSFKRPEDITDGQFDQLRSIYKKIFKRRIEYFKGQVAEDSDTDIIAHFGGPGSVSQHARFAVQCALDILEYFKQWNNRNKSDKPVPDFSISIDTYYSLLSTDQESQTNKEYLNYDTKKTINYLQSLNCYNHILASNNTYLHIHRFIKCKQLHSDNDGQKAYQVISDRDIPTVFSPQYVKENPLIGRKKELTKIQNAWKKVKKGEPQLIWVSGPPGIGKSHLIYSFVLGLKEDLPKIFICQCLSGYTNTPYYPLIQMFKHALKIKTNSEKEKELHIKKFVEQLGLDEDKCVPLILGLLETEKIENLEMLEDDVQEKSYLLVQKAKIVEKNREFILEILKSISKEPLILLLKDLDYMDPSTKKLFNQLLEDIIGITTSQKILIIASYNGPKPIHAKGISDIEKNIELEPLSYEYSRHVACNIIKKNEISINNHDLEILLKKAGGIPHSIYAAILNQNGPDSWFVKIMSELDNISDIQQIL